MRRILMVFVVSVAGSLGAGCSTSTPGGAYLYDKGDPPKLVDSEIKVETFRRARGKRTPDIRTITCLKGDITASLTSPRAKTQGTGTVPFEAYSKMWGDLHEKGFEYSSDPVDTSGGYFHVITLTLDLRTHQFTAQDRSSFLGLGSKGVQDRLQVSNSIIELVEATVEKVPYEPPTEESETPGP